ncbi:hypothetical protein [Vibrio vulnificus]|uniref:hypothetical protein n=1 Tax=Vibrio vulnificus TaxID=672 RepID=UPI0011C7633E|nr:hypothetical protein [Vibrio vulnificus]
MNTYNRAQNLSLILSRLVPVSFVFLSQVINIPFSLSGLVSSILACLIGYIGVVLSKRVGIKMHIETTNKRRYWVLNLSDSPKLLSHLWVVVFSLQSMFFFIVLDNNYQLSSYDINYVILSGAMGGVISNWFYKKLENYLCILLLVWMFTSLFFIVNDSFLALIISSFFAALSSQVLFVFCNNQYILSLVGDDISSDVASKQFYGAIIPVFIFYLISFLSYENIKIFYFLFLIFTSPFLYFLFKLNKVSYD